MAETIFEARVFMSIPTSIITEILARLPPKTVIRCRCVCKAWLKLISEPEFVDLHLSKSPTCLIVHKLPELICSGTSVTFRLLEVEDEIDHHCVRRIAGTESVMHKSLKNSLNASRISCSTIGMTIIGSIDGLVCIYEFDIDYLICTNEFEFESELIHVWNPYIRERITVQIPAGGRNYPNVTSYGFGTRSGKYLVVRIFQKIEITDESANNRRQICDSTCHVYTIGDGVWKSIGHAPYMYRSDDEGFFFNGNFHWIISDKDSPEQICCLDLEKELFEPFPPPPEFVQRQGPIPKLNLYNGCLSVCEVMANYDIVIWVMKEYGVQNSWSKEVVISQHGVVPVYLGGLDIIKVFKDGEILLLWRYEKKLFAYHPQRKTVQYIDAAECMTAPSSNSDEIHPRIELKDYVSSIVSLKSMGVVNVSRS